MLVCHAVLAVRACTRLCACVCACVFACTHPHGCVCILGAYGVCRGEPAGSGDCCLKTAVPCPHKLGTCTSGAKTATTLPVCLCVRACVRAFLCACLLCLFVMHARTPARVPVCMSDPSERASVHDEWGPPVSQPAGTGLMCVCGFQNCGGSSSSGTTCTVSYSPPSNATAPYNDVPTRARKTRTPAHTDTALRTRLHAHAHVLARCVP